MKNVQTEKRSLFSEVVHLINYLTNNLLTLAIVNKSILSIMIYGRLNHHFLKHICNVKLTKIDIKLITNKFVKVKGVQKCGF